MGVSNAIWDKRGPLGAGEWERVRLYPHVTERMLQQAASLEPITRIAVQVQERLDGSGYPRGLRGSAIPRPARVLAAADVYQALREPRAHRPAREPDTAAAGCSGARRRPAGSTATRPRRCWPRPVTGCEPGATARPD